MTTFPSRNFGWGVMLVTESFEGLYMACSSYINLAAA